MKTLQHLLLGLLFFTGALSQAQVTVNVNVGSQPSWGPAGYTDVRYYYLPDIDTYYDVSTSQYLYVSNGNWIRATALPPAYRSYNLYNGYKVVITNYRDATPYVYYKTHKANTQKVIKALHKKTLGYRRDLLKKVLRTHPETATKPLKETEKAKGTATEKENTNKDLY